MEPRTTITYKGSTYPFYKTNRGRVDFENAGFTNAQIIEGKTLPTLALVYYIMCDCAKRAGTPVSDSFEQFIDDTDPDITDVFIRLADARQKTEDGSRKPIRAKEQQETETRNL
jgi:hypothetical protein